MLDVKIAPFEGPLELLLELITSHKLEINQVALAEITDQYLSAIADIQKIHPGEIADFLVIASTLLLIKSRALLPQLGVSSEEEENMFALEARLHEYKRWREAGKSFQLLIKQAPIMVTRSFWQNFPKEFSLPEKPPTPEEIATKLRQLTTELTSLLGHKETKIIARVISIEAKINEILERVERATRLTINDLAGSSSRAELILAFLALLFLFRQKTITLSQSAKFGSIEIKSVPKNE